MSRTSFVVVDNSGYLAGRCGGVFKAPDLGALATFYARSTHLPNVRTEEHNSRESDDATPSTVAALWL